MQQLLIYLLKVSLTLILLVCFYQFVLRRLTFHTANRFFLLAAMLLPFLIPMVNLELPMQATSGAEPLIIRWVPATESVTSRLIAATAPGAQENRLGIHEWLVITWSCGVALLLLNSLVSFASLARLRRHSSTVYVNGIEACSVAAHIAPFSFGNKIFLPAGIPEGQGLSGILSHELVHVKQKHTIDILLAEVVCALLWFNPFVWIMRSAVRQNLEFIADNHVISTGVGRQEYQLLLLSVLGRRSYGMTSQFNLSSLKNRIKMMNKNSNSRTQLLRFAILLPLAAVIMLSFRKPARTASSVLTYKAVVMDISTRQPVAGVTLREQFSGREAVTDKNGIVEISISGTGKKTLKVRYSRTGYASIESNLSVNPSTEEDVVLTELVGIRTGNTGEKCGDCFTSIFMGETDLLTNPGKALDQHLGNKGKASVAVASVKDGKTNKGNAKVAIDRNAGTVSVSGDSAVIRESGGVVVYNNARITPVPSGSDYKGLIVMNGREMDWKQFKTFADSVEKTKSVGEIIASVHVMNGDEGKIAYGEKGSQGVMVIEGKKQ
ncbi:MAG: hypothetical protein EOO09_07405 [Chitinophagaceae bacterium]|nr:MAG: hypothetical protein EOO09_07405 [Chitinophagaceae bacterium]